LPILFLLSILMKNNYMAKLKVKEFDNENLLVDFVNNHQIQRDDIVLIEHVRGEVVYRLFWYYEVK
jgi:hypothetical protein